MPLIVSHGGRLLASGTPEVMEGALSHREALMLEWPTRESFLAFWQSEAYAQIKPLREKAAEWQAVLLDGGV